MPAFSINIIVRDNPELLRKCLHSLVGLSDDLVVVVDSRSSADTKTAAEQFTPKVYVRKFVDFSVQRHFAASKSLHDWVFTIDSDETVSPGLYKYLANFYSTPTSLYSAYSIKRQNIIFNRYIRHTNWDPNGIIRLVNKNDGNWSGNIHEVWHSQVGKVGFILESIVHSNYSSVEEFMTKLNLYTSKEAEQYSSFSYSSFFIEPTIEFIRRYLIHAGFLDGYHGLYLSFLMWFYKVSVWVKVWQNQNVNSL